MINIRIATDYDEFIWQNYCQKKVVDNHAYYWPWRSIIRSIFSHKPCYLLALDSNLVVGIAPLFFVNSFLFGRALVSVPYLNAGGIIADNQEVSDLLISKCRELANSREVNYAELRQRTAINSSADNLILRQHKVAMLLPLSHDAEILFDSFPAKLRSQINRPIKEGVTVKVSQGYDSQAIEDFYYIFCRNMRDLGIPVYPRALFAKTAELFAAQVLVVIAYQGERPVAAGFLIGAGKYLEILWASSLRSENYYSPNMLMYWEAIKAACQQGYEIFDFGRSSPDSGTFHFKQQWGAQPLTLNWQYLGSSVLPEISNKNAKFSLLSKMWQKLPLPLANTLGSSLTKHLP
ncbi:MAG: FemAB family PEP-CTERM system-associated protein [Deltaproteobacteria bacterium]|nr:FemAB family PEP-CTERM system-associated protein [Deltaproteobacteria bacterium]